MHIWEVRAFLQSLSTALLKALGFRVQTKQICTVNRCESSYHLVVTKCTNSERPQWKYRYIYELYFCFMPGHFNNRGHEWPSMTQPKSSSMSASIWKCGWSANYRCMELYLHNSVDWGWRETFPLFVSFPLHRSDADGWSGRLIHSFPGMAWMSQLPRTVCPRHTWNVARVDIRAGSKNKMSPVWRRRRRCDNVSPTWKAEGQQDKKSYFAKKELILTYTQHLPTLQGFRVK